MERKTEVKERKEGDDTGVKQIYKRTLNEKLWRRNRRGTKETIEKQNL